MQKLLCIFFKSFFVHFVGNSAICHKKFPGICVEHRKSRKKQPALDAQAVCCQSAATHLCVVISLPFSVTVTGRIS